MLDNVDNVFNRFKLLHKIDVLRLINSNNMVQSTKSHKN